ncbi:AraC family transcriptional regulator [Flavobacteriaceae bacterium F89]|uniref:AraC family transcriptional regulator n=1 Tax=Cerina litoralis TaxID=2874477 RepID=A0AAE3EUX2_9FLAO|nr:AraC family transcriptional regulator [Cerina litoralis]MCG2460744.1 AraC family transcriptional regulator [Cerina litoralis]
MKLHLLNRRSAHNHSFKVTHNRYPNFLRIWHHHPELELVLVSKSTGTRFIGDSIEKFGPGEVVLIGKDLPHMWLNDDIYFQGKSDLTAEAVAAHFKEDFLGSQIFMVPEMKHIGALFERASQGIKFESVTPTIIERIHRLPVLENFEKAIGLLEILHLLAMHREYKLLCSKGFTNSLGEGEDINMDKANAYIFKNFNTPIGSKDVATVLNMNPSAFSRYFKRIHRKTFTKYINEIRIGYACKLLMEEKNTVTAVCYESGFNNISNFNRQFKQLTGMSPSEYVKYHTD